MYREPAVYLWQKNNPKYMTGTLPALIPVIFGPGANSFKKTVALKRGEGPTDTLPSTVVKSIVSVGNYSNSTDYSEGTDYSLVEGNKINWNTTEDANAPEMNATYYVTYIAGPEADQYEGKLISSYEEVDEFFGPEFKQEDGDICPISVAARIMLDVGCRLFYAKQIEPDENGNVGIEQYRQACNELQFLPDAYRLVPLALDVEVNNIVLNHVLLMSDPEERMERRAMFGAVHDSSNFTEVKNNVGGYAKAINCERINIPYPDIATRRLTDGNLYNLPAPYICAAIAALEATQPVQQSLTKARFSVFNELKGVKMLRAQKNLLAADGVMILEQVGQPGTPIEIRHGLTTDMSSVQTRENSIITIKDYCSKYIRNGLSPYIGRENITPETITRIKASTNALLYVLAKQGVIVSGAVTELMQDSYNPDTLVMKIVIDPPYPCNYIEITLFLN